MTTDKKPLFTVRQIVLIGMFAAFLAVMSQISLPMPGGVPITIQVFAVSLTAVVLGAKAGTTATLVYILLGIVGLPIFANFQGGLGVLMGTAGGYIIGWIPMAFLAGIGRKAGKGKAGLIVNCLLALLGLALVEGIGGLWWCYVANGDIHAIMIYSFTAFIPKDIVITVIAVVLGRSIAARLGNAGLLNH